MRFLLALLLLLLGAAVPASARDWRTHVVESEAGWTFGRPDAPVLTEYASFGCPHCGEFSAAAGFAIAERVKAGKLRYAFRPFLIFPQDRAAVVLARCVAPGQRLGFIKAVMAAQGRTKARMDALDRSDDSRQAMFMAELQGPVILAPLLGRATGLADLAGRHGLSDVLADACLTDPREHRWAEGADLAARVAGVRGTPTFEWKGERLKEDITPAKLIAALPR